MTSAILLGMIGPWQIVLIAFFLMVFTIPFVVAFWLLFEKANQEGWKSLTPIYNVYILIKIERKPTYWLLLLFIPILAFGSSTYNPTLLK
tara:strand:- start:231 stop:500 length:270 start_codon:yes stop_codon:yes gene_type:complete